jgi:tripartite ATP-independent transporter DctP family solute receptor
MKITAPSSMSRRTFVKASLGTAAGTWLTSRGSSARAQSARATTLRFGGPMPLTTNYGQAMVKFGDELAKLSNNQIKIEVYPSNQLGGLKDMLTAVQLGTQSMVIATPAWVSNFAKQMDVFSLLYIAKSEDKLFKALDGPFGKRMAAYTEPAGLKVLNWWNSGPRHMLNNARPINAPADMKGLKMRVQSSQVWLESMRALGANPITLDFPEVYLALQQNTIDGFENPAPDIAAGKFYEVGKYLSLTAHTFDIFVVIINKKLWDGFNPEHQAMIAQAMQNTTEWQRTAQTAEVKAALDQLRGKMQVNDVSDADRQLFAKAVRPVYDKFAAKLGKDLIDQAIHEFG